MHQGVVRQRCVLRHAHRQLQRLVEGSAFRHQILRKTNALTILRVVHTAGEHHVGHAGRTDQFGNAHRTAAAHKNAAGTFRQGIERRSIGHTNVASACQLQAATDHSALQSCDHRNGPVLHTLQRGVPHAGMVQALAGITLFELTQVQACTEVRALAGDHGRPHAFGHVFEQIPQREDESVVQGVALGAAGQADHRHFLFLTEAFEMDIGVLRKSFHNGAILVIVNNQIKSLERSFSR